MTWYNRLQERIGITPGECYVLMGACLLFLLGLGARYLQQIPAAIPPAVYSESDSLFQMGTETWNARRDSGSSILSGNPGNLRFDLNTASLSELDQLPRIGPVIASRIISYREQHGPFRDVNDLLEVNGIGEKTLSGLKPYLYIGTEE